jgi:hypothetical protein
VRAQGLPLNTIVLAVVALIVLVVVVIAFVPAVGNLFGTMMGTAPTGDADTCQIHCSMLQANLFVEYPIQAKNYRYCTDECVTATETLFPCELNGETLSYENCQGLCDSDGDCPTESCTQTKDCTNLCNTGTGACGYPNCPANRCNCETPPTGHCEETTACPCP